MKLNELVATYVCKNPKPKDIITFRQADEIDRYRPMGGHSSDFQISRGEWKIEVRWPRSGADLDASAGPWIPRTNFVECLDEVHTIRDQICEDNGLGFVHSFRTSDKHHQFIFCDNDKFPNRGSTCRRGYHKLETVAILLACLRLHGVDEYRIQEALQELNDRRCDSSIIGN